MTPPDRAQRRERPSQRTMQDKHTRKTLDHIADLFLTGTAPAAPTPTPTPDDDQVSLGGFDAGPPAMGASWSESSGPFRLPPKVAAQHPWRDEHEQDPLLHLTNEPASAQQSLDERPDEDDVPKARPVNIQAVFVGNLPGFGLSWLTQYAWWLAHSAGPVGVLHVTDDDALALDVIAPNRATLDRLTPNGDHATEGDLIDTMHDLTRSGDTAITNWLIHLPMSTAPGVLSKTLDINQWTMLCGVDDAAIVATYLWLKQLGTVDRLGATRRVGLMVMGSDDAKARAAATNLNKATRNFLRTPVELIGTLARMTPVIRKHIGRFPVCEELWQRTLAFLEDLAVGVGAGDDHDEVVEPAPIELHAEPQSAPLEAMTAAYESPDEPEPYAFDDELLPLLGESQAGQAPLPEPQITRGAVPPKPAQRATLEPAAASAPPRMPTQTESREHAWANTSHDAPMLAQFIAGCTPIEARCPRQSGAMLGVDAAGRLHLMQHVQTADGAGNDAAAQQAQCNAVVDLLDACDWAREHLSVLGLTMPHQTGLTLDTQCEPIVHLFTHHARCAVDLVNRMGPVVQLHLLQPVRLGDVTRWVCNDLN